MLDSSKIKKSSNRSFGLIFFIVFFIIALWPLKNNGDYSQIRTFPLCFSLIFLVLGILNSKFLTPLNTLWIKLGLILGAIVAPIVMGFIFFLVVTPVGFSMKILGKDLLSKKIDKNMKSYWIKREKSSSTMKKQF